ncbi:MAG: hypothetical protein HY774_22025 [Acidobacteria bacterium]|nr:hypothetical protein [Acidobacteriota bacterium]
MALQADISSIWKEGLSQMNQTFNVRSAASSEATMPLPHQTGAEQQQSILPNFLELGLAMFGGLFILLLGICLDPNHLGILELLR